MAANSGSQGFVLTPGSRDCVVRSGAPRRKCGVDMEELAMTVPGGLWKERGTQRLLLHVISYIHFLQRRIQETQSRLLPHINPQGVLPLWTPSRGVDVTYKRRNVRPGVRRRQSRGSEARTKLTSKQITWQTLVPYVSSSSSDNGDGSPWLVCVSPRSPHSPCTPQSSSVAPLELSPLLLSAPADDLPQGLFEEVEIRSWSSEDVQDSAAATAFSLDHSYQSSCKSSKHCPLQPTKEGDVEAKCPDRSQQPPVEGASRSGFRRRIRGYGAKNTARRLQAHSSTSRDDTVSSGHGAGTAQRPRTFSRLHQLRKKCVNGFIMFCRLNRRPYLSAHPGKASTTATKDLAELWRVMSARERRPYCMKALQFSLLNDRLVKRGSSGLPHENVSPPKPVSVLLAEKARSQEVVEPKPGPPGSAAEGWSTPILPADDQSTLILSAKD